MLANRMPQTMESVVTEEDERRKKKKKSNGESSGCCCSLQPCFYVILHSRKFNEIVISLPKGFPISCHRWDTFVRKSKLRLHCWSIMHVRKPAHFVLCTREYHETLLGNLSTGKAGDTTVHIANRIAHVQVRLDRWQKLQRIWLFLIIGEQNLFAEWVTLVRFW